MMSREMKTGSATAWRQNVAEAKLENQVVCIEMKAMSVKMLHCFSLPDNYICPIMNVLAH